MISKARAWELAEEARLSVPTGTGLRGSGLDLDGGEEQIHHPLAPLPRSPGALERLIQRAIAYGRMNAFADIGRGDV